MKILIVGASGTIGSAVADRLAGQHTVVRASRHGNVRVDVRDPSSLEAVLRDMSVDAVVACAGDVMEMRERVMGPLTNLGEAQFQYGLQRLISELALVQLCGKYLPDGGSLTLTTGQLSSQPMPGTTVASIIGAGVESLVRSAALEMPRGIRVNAVSPGFVKETMEKLGMDSQAGIPAATLAKFYEQCVEGAINGVIINPMENRI